MPLVLTADSLQFAADGKVKADIELQPLASINIVLDRLEAGEVPSRVVLDFLAADQGSGSVPTGEAVPA